MLAVKTVVVPEQIEFPWLLVTFAVGKTDGFTVTVIGVEFAVVGLAHENEEVSVTETAFPFANVLVVKVDPV